MKNSLPMTDKWSALLSAQMIGQTGSFPAEIAYQVS